MAHILDAAVSAPDHGRLAPWRFVLLPADQHKAFGEVLTEALQRRCAAKGRTPTPAELAKERTKLGRAPLVVVVAAERQVSNRVPWDEQLAAVSAATAHMLLAATALGYGSMWRTGPAATDPHVKEALALSEGDAIVGFVYLGTPDPERVAAEVARTGAESVTRSWFPAASGRRLSRGVAAGHLPQQR